MEDPAKGYEVADRRLVILGDEELDAVALEATSDDALNGGKVVSIMDALKRRPAADRKD